MEKLDPKSIENVLALTPLQEGMLFHYLKDSRSNLYCEQLCLEIVGEIDRLYFEKAWNKVIEANEMLRTVFRWEKLVKPSQLILKKHQCRVLFYDLSDKGDSQLKEALEAFKRKDRDKGFDLQDVAFRLILCKLATAKYEIIISNHHILYDGWSTGIILKEFFNAYRQLSKGETVSLPAKPEFKLFVKWIKQQDVAKQEKFWGNYLKGFGIQPGETKPSTYKNSKKRQKNWETSSTSNKRFQFSAELENKLDNFTKSHNITMASLIYSAWGILLQKYHAVSDIIFDATVSGRSNNAGIKGIENIVGLFINTLPLRIQTLPGETVSTFLSRTYHMFRQWSEFENSSILQVREMLDKSRQENLFDSVVVFENYPIDNLTAPDTAPLSLHSFSIVERTFYDLTVIITTIDRIEFNITYNNNIFNEVVISHLFEQLVLIVEAMVNDPGKEIPAINIWAENERENLLAHIHLGQEIESERKRKRERERKRESGMEMDYTAPRDELEEKLVDIWAEVLNINKDIIGIDHNFFEFGGHSLKASLLVSVLQRTIEIKISVAEIFHRPTIKALSEYVRDAVKQGYSFIGTVEKKEYYALSASQKRMFALQQIDPDSIAYNVSECFLVETPGCDGDAEGPEWLKTFEAAIKKIIERHESLRTSFIFVNGEPVQKIHEYVEFKLESYDLALEINSCENIEVKNIHSFIRPFDLSRTPLMRLGIIKTEKTRHILVFDAHHIVFDGVSMNIFIKELTAFYEGKELPALRIQYKDFSEWQKKQLGLAGIKTQENYWLSLFAGEVPALNLPTDYPRSQERITSTEGDKLYFTIKSETREKLKAVEKKSGATLYMILLAAYDTVLMKYSGQEDIVVGTLTDGRPDIDLKSIIGVMITTLAMRNFPRGEMSFMQFLHEVKSNSLKAFENADYPFEELLKNIRLKQEATRNQVFNTMFLLQNFEWPEFSFAGLVLKPYRFKTNASTFEWRITAVERENEVEIEIQYATRLFKKETIERFAAHYIRILNEIGQNPQGRLGKMQLLSEAEKHRILFEFNTSDVKNDEHKTVIQWFEEQVQKTPEAVASVARETREKHEKNAAMLHITYLKLKEQSNDLAGFLIEKGVLPDTIVGIMMERSVEMIVGIMGILKSGGAYLPIDPEYPQERIDYMLKDSKATLTINYEFLKEAPQAPLQHSTFVIPRTQHSNLIYVIYTSGTTGKPKGAGIYHRGFFNLIYWFATEFGLNANDRNLLLTSLSFDLTQKNIFTPLVTGGSLTLPAVDYFDPADILQTVEKKQVTWLNCTPGMIYKLIEYSQAEDLKKLFSLKYAFLGGEPLSQKGMQKWIKSQYFNAQIVNTYGPTECTDICASFSLKEPLKFNEENVPTGKPIYNVQLYVLDQWFEVSPVGVTGELFISGKGVGPGYLNNPELTCEKFKSKNEKLKSKNESGALRANFHHSAFIIQHSKLYRTGDRVRWMLNGNIEFLGRIDHQVKIRGFRIELGEIESRLLTYGQIKEAVVLALKRKDASNSDAAHYLCTYFTAGKKLELKELKSYLAAQLPGYMIPSYFMQIEKFPLTHHGKIDRRLLPMPEADAVDNEEICNEILNKTEKKLVKIWQEILGIEKIGVVDNFFELGGDSLLVIQAIARIREIFGVDLPIREYFEHSNIKDLAKAIEMLEKDIVHIPKAPGGVLIPLSFSQEQVWFLQQLNERNASYFVPRVIRIKGKLDVKWVERTFDEIIRRHEILRTVFPTVEGRAVQRVLEHSPFKLPVIDMVVLEKSKRDEKVEKWMAEEGRRLFDFEKGPMIRITLLILQEEEHLLVLTEHHLVHDGWTQGVLLKEFIAIFYAFCEGKTSPLPPLPIQYKDYAWWQRNYLQGEVLEKQLAYWKEKLLGLEPLLELPTDRPRPPEISGNGEVIRLFLTKELSDDLITFSRQSGVTLFMTMLGVFKVLLYRYTGTGDLCVGTGVANRRYKEMEGMLGMVINTLALRTEIHGEFTFEECLQEIKTTCLEAYENEDTPFEKIVAELRPERSLSYTPVFQNMYSFMDTPAETLRLPGLELHVEEVHNRSAKFDINIIVEPPSGERLEETGGRIEIIWEYNTDIFNDETMNRMIGHNIRLLEEVVRQPGISIAKLPMLGADEIQHLLVEWNDTGADYPRDKTIHQLFEEQVAKTPDYIAIVGNADLEEKKRKREEEKGNCAETLRATSLHITYLQLNEQSNRLAGLLIEKGVRPDTIVGIMMERSIEMIIGIMGTLKSGGAYLPIDPEYPLERIQYMLRDSKAKILISKSKIRNSKFKTNPNDQKINDQNIKQYFGTAQVLNFENLNFEFVSCFDICASNLIPSNLAYIIYTSGSTGKPKGVMIEHRSVHNFIAGITGIIEFKIGKIILALTTITFDIFGLETLLSLCRGLKIILATGDHQRDMSLLEQLIIKNCIDMMQATPTRMQMFTNCGTTPSCLKYLKEMLVGGEQFPDKLLEDLRQLSKAKIYNMYGPTETTIWSSAAEVTKTEKITIGNPINNTQIYILNKYAEIQPVGIAGELYIRGDGLARGYLNRPELTTERFIALSDPQKLLLNYHPPLTNHHTPLYYTGDLARWLPDGDIEFLGRIDRQVKIRGYRIELGEIENHLLKHEKIKEVVLSANEETNGNKYLAAYFISNLDIPAIELRDYLLKNLPDYMIPSYFMQLKQLPLTVSGKIDRNALPKPGFNIVENYSAPSNEVEKELAALWAATLGKDTTHASQLQSSIGIYDNFFHRGGHSLKATILVSKIHKAFHINVPLAEIFKTPTIRGLANYIKAAIKDKYVSIEPVEKKKYYSLSSAQKRLYILYQMDRQGVGYNIPSFLVLEGEIDKEKLEYTFRQLIHRHESLRTSFHLINDEPVQRIHDEVEFEIEYKDFATDKHEQTRTFLKNFIISFDLSKGPLLRVGLLKEKGDRHILMVDMHHIISDGISMNILVKDFMVLYQGEFLSELQIQYKDFSNWQNDEKQAESLKRQKEFWLNEFAGEIPVLELPADYPRPAVQSFEGSRIPFEMDKETTGVLKTLALELGATIYMILMSLYIVFLAKLTNQEDIIIGSPIAGRRHVDLGKIIGMFVNTLALRNYPLGEKPFIYFLEEVKEKTLVAFDNQEYQYEDLVEQVGAGVNRDTARNPLFDTMFALQNMGSGQIEIPGVRIAPYDFASKISKFDLSLSIIEKDENLLFTFEYSTNLFKKETVERFIIYFKNVAAGVINNKEQKISDMEFLTHEEKKKILCDFNDTDREYPRDKTIHGLFAEQAIKTPDRIAVFSHGLTKEEVAKRRREDEKNVGADLGVCPYVETWRAASLQYQYQITYRQLNEQSNRLAGLLIEKGVLADNIVGIMVERSIEMVVGIFGILKSGGAYLPIDPGYPQERIDYMLKDSRAKILVNKYEARISKYETNPNVQKINDQNKNIEELTVLDLDHLNFQFVSDFGFRVSDLNPLNLTYVIYTSGSTGKPKGVMINHGSAVNLLMSMQEKYPFTPADTYLLKTSYIFDVSVTELFGWCIGGGRLAILGKNGEKDPQVISKWIEWHHVTHINFVPSMFNVFVNQLDSKNIKRLFSLKYIFLAGEMLLPEFVNKFRELNKSTRLENIYGPTESSVYSSKYSLSDWNEKSGNIPIGKPMPNIRLYILDKNNCPQPPGIVGELIIAGIGVARGYLNRPELTAERFIMPSDFPKLLPNDYSPLTTPHSPFYKTGDLARRLPDGNIEFLGRLDQQVKIRGFRIELGEIENRLLMHEQIKGAVVLDKAYPGNDKYLVAYFVSKNELSEDDLRKHLLKDLPDYMIPSYFVRLAEIPLTPNGKVNRRALPESEFNTGKSYTAPRDEAGKKLVVLWAEVLGRDVLHASQLQVSIGINDNFFHLGGHSLKAIAMVNKIQKTFAVSITLQDVFLNPTIAGIAQVIKNSKVTGFINIEKQPEKDYYELSYAQKRLWFINKTGPGRSLFNMPGKLTIYETCDLKLITGILEQLTARHESLRTCFKEKDKAPVQVIEPKGSFRLNVEVIDLREFPMPERENVRAELYLKEAMHIFDLEQPSLFRVKIINCAAREYDLIFNMHHIISDGWSLEILKQEFQQLFDANRTGLEPALVPMELQYKDYAAWQNRILADGAQMGKAQAFWREHLGNLPVMNLPYDYSRSPGVDRKESAGYRLWIPGELTNCLRNMAIERNASLFMVLFAGFNLLLAKMTGQENIIVAIPAAARQHDAFKNIIGLFVNTLILCNRVAADESFPGFFARLQDNTFKVLEYQGIPLELICGQLKIKYPEIPVFFNMINTGNTRQESLENLESYHLEAVQDAKFDIVFYLLEYKNGIKVECHYYKNRFKAITIEKLMAQYKEILVNITGDPTRDTGEYFASGKKRKFKRGNNVSSG